MAHLEIETAQEEEVPKELTEKLKRLTIEVDIRATWVKHRVETEKWPENLSLGLIRHL